MQRGRAAARPAPRTPRSLHRKTGLTEGRHTIRLVITGEKNPSSSNILPLVDAFHVLPAPAASRSLYIDTHWNYPDFGHGGGDYYRPAVRVTDGATGTVSLRARQIRGALTPHGPTTRTARERGGEVPEADGQGSHPGRAGGGPTGSWHRVAFR
ncbi:hypothetical protein [Streptomyces sp. BE133]|uniref:hypothetical protein n=1 Tax=Streptomyces sp. BE133 TaxID=3002523 RepID=UPI002E78F91D|nr:hypothetical protein [Streptomyces sp. BE133]MEE1806739.1 hypothetical protein [Streptomyces sp. BE133]